jgi:hypothetical protein
MKTRGRERGERRLAAILAADVVGYSRLMDQDEFSALNFEPWVLIARSHGQCNRTLDINADRCPLTGIGQRLAASPLPHHR